MSPLSLRRIRVTALACVAATVVAACSPPTEDSGNGDTGSGQGTSAASAQSAEDLGGMDKLVEAAKKEGQLNVIALPPDWANYGEIIKTFQSKYGIKVTSDQPDALLSRRDLHRAAAQGPVQAPRRLRPRRLRRGREHRDVRALQGGDLRRGPRGPQGRRTARGSTTTAAT